VIPCNRRQRFRRTRSGNRTKAGPLKTAGQHVPVKLVVIDDQNSLVHVRTFRRRGENTEVTWHGFSSRTHQTTC